MKTILKITTLCILFCCSGLNAQDTQKWYADDIYYDASEKEISYVEIIENNDYYDEIDSLEESYEGRMSYSMRINRFHRNYYGSSLSFNYGYFHDPYIYNGFGCTMYAHDPFYYGWGWDSPYYGYSFYNPWYSPWYNNHYAWHNPYGYGYNYGYGYGYNPYYYGTGIYASSGTTYYGPRNGTTTNVLSSSDTRPARNNPSVVNTTSTGKTQNPIFRNSVINSKENTSQKKYTIPKNSQARWEYSNSSKKNTPKTSIANKIEKFIGTNSSKPKVNSNTNFSNKKSTSTYTPSRSSNTSRTTRTTRTSTTSRKPR